MRVRGGNRLVAKKIVAVFIDGSGGGLEVVVSGGVFGLFELVWFLEGRFVCVCLSWYPP